MAIQEHNSPNGAAAARDGRRAAIWMLGALLFLAVAWTLRATMMVTMPVACALLVALALWPVCKHVRDAVPKRLRWLGATAAMLVFAAFIAIFLAGLALAARQVVALATEFAPQLQERLQQSQLSGLLDQGQQLSDVIQSFGSSALGALNTAWQTIAGVILIFFLVLLMLTEARNWREKVSAAGSRGNPRDWPQIAAMVGSKFRTFFLTRLALGALTAILYVGWLALFGVDYLLLWGLLAVLLNFIPTIGSLIAGTLPVLFAFAQKDPGTALVVAAGLLVIEQIMGNFVDPKLMGRQLSLSPLVVLISLLFWSWVWGVPGAFLSVPLTVLLTMVFAHIEPLKPIALLLTSESNMEELEEYSRR